MRKELLGLILISVGLGGCGRSVRWDLGRFEDVQPRAAAENKLTFVYFKAWWSVECTRFEEQVLLDPEVLAQLEKMRCVPLNYNWDDKLAVRWGLTEPPAFAIVSPEGQVCATGMGVITKEQLLRAIQTATLAGDESSGKSFTP